MCPSPHGLLSEIKAAKQSGGLRLSKLPNDSGKKVSLLFFKYKYLTLTWFTKNASHTGVGSLSKASCVNCCFVLKSQSAAETVGAFLSMFLL